MAEANARLGTRTAKASLSAAELDAQMVKRARLALLISIGVTVLLYVVPYGQYVGYPLLLLSTLAHELGHGVAAMIIGGDFHQFLMHADGSGVAQWHGDVGRLGRAFVSAGGLVGPAVVAGVCFALGRRPTLARWCLIVLGALLVLAELLVVRSLFGFFFVGIVAAAFLAIGIRAPKWVSQMALVFVATQLALSVFSRGDYLFTDVAHTAAGNMPSDVAQMADALLLPYWFWGALCGTISVAVLGVGVYLFLRGVGRPGAKKKPKSATAAAP